MASEVGETGGEEEECHQHLRTAADVVDRLRIDRRHREEDGPEQRPARIDTQREQNPVQQYRVGPVEEDVDGVIAGRCATRKSVVEREGQHEHRSEHGALGIAGEGLKIPEEAARVAQRADVGV